jgi:hypothetical protein
VPEEIGQLADDAAVGFIDANQGGADFGHKGLNHTSATLLPLG